MRKWKEIPVVSGMLVAVNALVYVMCAFTDSHLYRLGNLNVVDVLVKGEYGRVVWAMFLHSGIGHIFNNMLILFFLGAMIEKEVGHVRYAAIFFLSGIAGNLASLFVKASHYDFSGTVGASGAVFGLDGVLLALVLTLGGQMAAVTPGRVMAMILLSLYNGFSADNIDNAAHVGGLAFGFFSGCVVGIRRRGRHSGQR